MITSLLNYAKAGFSHPITQIILKILSITSIISTCITVGGLVFYSIGYSFLYGYYFSGISNPDIGLINLLISNVPFPFYSVIITSAVFIVIIIFFVILLWNIGISLKHISTKNDRLLGLARILIIIFLFVIFHFSLTSFFVGGFSSSSEKTISFFSVWLGPIALAILIYFFVQMQKGMISASSGMCYGFLILIILGNFFDLPPSSVWSLGIFILGIPFSYFERFLKYSIYRFFLSIPFSTIIVFGLSLFLTTFFQYTVGNWIIIGAFIIVLSIFLSHLTIKLGKNTSNELSEEEVESNRRENKVFRKKFNGGTVLTLFIIVVLTFVITTIPEVAKITGTLFRSNIPQSSHQNIYYDGNPTPQLLNVELIAQKDDMYYISDSEAHMIILKTDKIRIEYSK